MREGLGCCLMLSFLMVGQDVDLVCHFICVSLIRDPSSTPASVSVPLTLSPHSLQVSELNNSQKQRNNEWPKIFFSSEVAAWYCSIRVSDLRPLTRPPSRALPQSHLQPHNSSYLHTVASSSCIIANGRSGLDAGGLFAADALLYIMFPQATFMHFFVYRVSASAAVCLHSWTREQPDLKQIVMWPGSSESADDRTASQIFQLPVLRNFSISTQRL